MTSQGAFENDSYAKQSYKVGKKIKNNISKHISAHLSSILCLVKNQSLLSFNPVMAAKDQAVQMLLHKLASHSKSGYNQIHATVEHLTGRRCSIVVLLQFLLGCRIQLLSDASYSYSF